jgi:hypothetical protein
MKENKRPQLGIADEMGMRLFFGDSKTRKRKFFFPKKYPSLKFGDNTTYYWWFHSFKGPYHPSFGIHDDEDNYYESRLLSLLTLISLSFLIITIGIIFNIIFGTSLTFFIFIILSIALSIFFTVQIIRFQFFRNIMESICRKVIFRNEVVIGDSGGIYFKNTNRMIISPLNRKK